MNDRIRPYRVKARVQNNRLWRALLNTFPDLKSQSDAARRLGMGPSRLGAILNLKVWPHGKRDWAADAWHLSRQLGESPEYLFDPTLYGQEIPPLELEVEAAQALGLLPPRLELPDERIERKELNQALAQALQTLTPREERVLKRLYELTSTGATEKASLEAIGEEFSVTRERIRQIRDKALRKLRDRRRGQDIRQLRELYEAS